MVKLFTKEDMKFMVDPSDNLLKTLRKEELQALKNRLSITEGEAAAAAGAGGGMGGSASLEISERENLLANLYWTEFQLLDDLEPQPSEAATPAASGMFGAH